MKSPRVPSIALLRLALVGLISLSLIVATTGSALPARAQSTGAAPATPVPPGQIPTTITVTGTGTVSVTPDVAHVTVGVTITDPSLSAAQEQATTVAQALIDVATENRIADADIQTASYSVTVIEDYDNNGNRTGERAYEVSNILTLTIRDLNTTGSVLDQLVDAGANVVYGISFDVSDPGPSVTLARTDAVTDARARADAYADGLGVEIVGVAAVTEQSAPQPAARSDFISQAEVSAASVPVPVAAGSTDLTVTVEVVFLIAN